MKFIIIILSVFFISTVAAQDSDATYLMLHKTYTLNEDGSYELQYHHKLKYHTYLSFHRKYGETFVVYDPTYQEVNVLKSQTTMADGKVVKAPENAFNRVLPRFAAGSGAYNDLRELVITHTGLERGAVVNLKYTIKSEKSPLNIFAGSEPLRYSSPVKALKLTFKVPKNIDLVFGGIQGEKVVNENDKYKVYTFTYSDLPAFEKTPNAGAIDRNVLMFNEGKKLADQLMAVLKSEAKPAEFAPAYTKAGYENMDEIMRIHRKLVKDMKTIHIPLSFQHFPVKDVNAIRLQYCGTPLEKAFLLKERYLQRDIPARIVFTIPHTQFDPDVVSVENIDDVFVMVPTKNSDPLLLSPYRIPDANPLYTNYNKVFVSVDAAGNLMQFEPTHPNTTDIRYTLDLGKNHHEIQYKGELNGAMAGWPGANLNSSKLFVNYLREIEEDISIERIDSVNIRGRFDADHYQYEAYLEAKLPRLKSGIHSFIDEPLPIAGNYVLQFGFPFKEVYHYEIPLDKEDFEIIRLPGEYSVDNPYFAVKTDIKKTRESVEIHTLFHLKKPVIPITHYEEFRNALVHLKKDNTKRVMVKIK